jgi:hypothetical protein
MLLFATLETGESQINFNKSMMTFRKNLDFKLIYGGTPQSASLFSKELEGYQGNSGDSSDLKFNHSLKCLGLAHPQKRFGPSITKIVGNNMSLCSTQDDGNLNLASRSWRG